MTDHITGAGPQKVYVSLCCNGPITYEGEPEFPGSEVVTMNCKCSRCEKWCTPVDVDAIFARIAELEEVIAGAASQAPAQPSSRMPTITVEQIMGCIAEQDQGDWRDDNPRSWKELQSRLTKLFQP